MGEVSGMVGFGQHGIDHDVVELVRLLPDHAVTRILKDVEPLMWRLQAIEIVLRKPAGAVCAMSAQDHVDRLI